MNLKLSKILVGALLGTSLSLSVACSSSDGPVGERQLQETESTTTTEETNSPLYSQAIRQLICDAGPAAGYGRLNEEAVCAAATMTVTEVTKSTKYATAGSLTDDDAIVQAANNASLEELDDDAGLSSTAAKRLIDNRPYSNVKQVDAVKGIGTVSLKKLAAFGHANYGGEPKPLTVAMKIHVESATAEIDGTAVVFRQWSVEDYDFDWAARLPVNDAPGDELFKEIVDYMGGGDPSDLDNVLSDFDVDGESHEEYELKYLPENVRKVAADWADAQNESLSLAQNYHWAIYDKEGATIGYIVNAEVSGGAYGYLIYVNPNAKILGSADWEAID